MKKLYCLFLSLLICIGIGVSTVNAEYVPTTEYFPLTVEKAEKAWEDVRKTYFRNEFSDNKWENKIKVIIVGMNSDNNAEYRKNTYGVTSSEDFVFLASPAWPEAVEFKSYEKIWTIPDKVYLNKNIPLYWVMNADILNSMNNDQKLIGMILHEFVHMYDFRPDKEFTEYTCDLDDQPTAYASREKFNDAYLFATKAEKGAIIPMYVFAQWLQEALCPFFSDCVNGVIPYTENPNIEYLTFVQMWTPQEIKTFFFRPVEYALYNMRKSDPNVMPCDILNSFECDTYNFLMNN